MAIEVWVRKIHDLDHGGSLHFTATFHNSPIVESEEDWHELTYSQWWEDCGITGETLECSCGLISIEHPGCGCWQYGHDKPSTHEKIDVVHAEMILESIAVAKKQNVGTPAEWRGLALLAIKDLKKQARTMRLIKSAQKLAQ